MRKYQQVSANLLSEFILGPLAESVGFDPEEAGRSLPVAVLSPDGLFITRLFQVVETGVQVQAFGRDGDFLTFPHYVLVISRKRSSRNELKDTPLSRRSILSTSSGDIGSRYGRLVRRASNTSAIEII